MAATVTSLILAATTATGATVIGTLAAVVLVRFGRFTGRRLFGAMIYAPIVMPEILTGLSTLLLFISLEVERGFWTVLIAHITFTASFVAVVVQSRLIGFDRDLEEAAMDLGSTPLHAFFSVTLPLIAPAVAAGWLLAFVLSFDDLLISRFTTGPGTNTLPMLIYAEARRGVKPEINAMCTMLITVVALSVIAVSLAAKWRETRSKAKAAAL
jgi:putrescine transport system permease protein